VWVGDDPAGLRESLERWIGAAGAAATGPAS